jgi:hypothetical protein
MNGPERSRIETMKPQRVYKSAGIAPLLLALLVLVGCATSDHLYLVKRSVKCSPFHDAIEFLPEAPERPHAKLAHVEAGQVLFFWTRWEALRKHLCLQAVGVGADAVILPTRSQHPYDIGFVPLSISGDNKKLTGVAIVYVEDDSPEALDALEAPAVEE